MQYSKTDLVQFVNTGNFTTKSTYKRFYGFIEITFFFMFHPHL